MSEVNNAAITTLTPTQLATSTGGSGLFSGNSGLFKLKPGNLQLVSSMTQQEGAIPGKIRVVETNQHFTELQVVILADPQFPKPRNYWQKGVHSKDGLLCFSTNGVTPHDKAKIKQHDLCSACKKADWAPYRAHKIADNLPPCRDYWKVFLAERTTKLPYWMNIGGKNDAPFKEACQNIVRTLAPIQAEIEQQKREGKTPRPAPEVYDISFTMFVKKEGAHYILGFKDFAPMSLEVRAEFGAIFADFARRRAEYEQYATSEGESAAVDAVSGGNTGAPATQNATQQTAGQPVKVAPRTPRPAVVIPKGPTITVPPVTAQSDEITI
jgi:hypothetical protein